MLLLLYCQELYLNETFVDLQRKEQQPNKELPVVLDTLKFEGVAEQCSVLLGCKKCGGNVAK